MFFLELYDSSNPIRKNIETMYEIESIKTFLKK